VGLALAFGLCDLSIRLPPELKHFGQFLEAAGNKPTGESSLVRPPTQSHIGNRSNHFYLNANYPDRFPRHVTANAFDFQNSSRRPRKAAFREPAFHCRVSCVQPDFEMTDLQALAQTFTNHGKPTSSVRIGVVEKIEV